MAPLLSAGILLYRFRDGRLELLLAHPGGPFWASKDDGAWSIPKGGPHDGEGLFAAARREFEEELGSPPPPPPAAGAIDLGEIRQRSGKAVHAFALAGDFDPATISSNLVEVSWPPGTGNVRLVPEVDRAGWFEPEAAAAKLNPAQAEFVSRLTRALAG